MPMMILPAITGDDRGVAGSYFAIIAGYLYNCQYSLNFIIYCVRIENYRLAYLYCLRKLKCTVGEPQGPTPRVGGFGNFMCNFMDIFMDNFT